jgi:hypothetical protein
LLCFILKERLGSAAKTGIVRREGGREGEREGRERRKGRKKRGREGRRKGGREGRDSHRLYCIPPTHRPLPS